MRQFTADDVVATFEEWARLYPPRRFMVYGLMEEPDNGGYDGEIVAWGLGFNDHVFVQSLGDRVGGVFRSTETMRRHMFRRDRDIRVLWLDPEPSGTEPE